MIKEGLLKDFFLKKKRAQVTIFIIIAITIIGAMLLFFFLIPRTEIETEFDERNPYSFIENCLKESIEETVNMVSLRGGSINPERYFTYNEIPIEYLCYTNEYDKRCIVQRPLLRVHVEEEIRKDILNDVNICFNSLRNNYEYLNYNVQLNPGKTSIEVLPKRIVTRFNYVLTVTKGKSDRYDSFVISLNNNLYELSRISQDIVEKEVLEGDVDVLLQMTLNPNIRIDKNLRGDGTKIYVLEDRLSGNKFQFALRNNVVETGH